MKRRRSNGRRSIDPLDPWNIEYKNRCDCYAAELVGGSHGPAHVPSGPMIASAPQLTPAQAPRHKTATQQQHGASPVWSPFESPGGAPGAAFKGTAHRTDDTSDPPSLEVLVVFRLF